MPRSVRVPHASVYVTCPDKPTAQRIARALVEQRLAACANIFPIDSVYRWEGRVVEEVEVAMLLKTRIERFDEVAAAVKTLHPYSVPCIVAYEIADGDKPYLEWIGAETSGVPDRDR